MQRWLNRDPIGEFGGLNLYTFAFNDSLNLIDPKGDCSLAFPSALNAARIAAGATAETLGVPAALGAGYEAGTLINNNTPIGGIGTVIGNLITPINPVAPTTVIGYNPLTAGNVNAPPISISSQKTPTPYGPPPVPVPGAPDVPWVQNGPQRDGVPSWKPAQPIESDMGGQPSASWDPIGTGHWDVDNGEGGEEGRQRYDWRGNPIDAGQAHNPDAPRPPGNGPSCDQ